MAHLMPHPIHSVERQACRILGIRPFRVITDEDVSRFREGRRLFRALHNLTVRRQRQPR